MTPKEFGLFFAEQRKKKGLTQGQIAGELKVSTSAVSKWERGLCLPEVSKFEKIARLFDLSLLEVLQSGENVAATENVNQIISSTIELATDQHISKYRKYILTSIILFIVLLGSIICIFTIAITPTKDANRVKSETEIHAYVDLKGSTHSRAITRTYDAADYAEFSQNKQKSIAEKTQGGIEGDIPAVVLDNETTATLVLQDSLYNDVTNIKVNKILVDVYSLSTETMDSGEASYSIENGKINIDLMSLPGEPSRDDWQRCTFEIWYQAADNEYVSVTTINVFLHEPEWN